MVDSFIPELSTLLGVLCSKLFYLCKNVASMRQALIRCFLLTFMAISLRHQPYKALYTAFEFVGTVLVKVPFWLLLSIPR